jgi:two-component system, OmpR family, sensor histidine kinase TctE
MSWKLKKRLSLRATMFAVLLPGMLVVIGAELWLTRIDAVEAANAAFDRSLHGAIKSVDANVSTASGGLAVELPYRLFEFFQLTARGNVYFRVATADGLVEIGSPDLPQPEEAPAIGVPAFYDAYYIGEPVRVGTYVRALERPLSPGGVQQLVIQVAESAESRRAFTRAFVARAAVRDALVISLVGVALAVVVNLLLRPVSRLAAQVTARPSSDLRPLEENDLPRDIQPLVHAVNQQLSRTKGLMERQQLFLDDASHQLRTPLATLHAQVGYAMRLREVDELLDTLRSIQGQLEEATRSTNQLLALARSDAVAMNLETFDLAQLVRNVATRLLPLARARGLDFGVDAAEHCPCQGDPLLLAEAIGNLAHNALSYASPEGPVTLGIQCDEVRYAVQVINTGRPVPAEIVSNLGQRFVKSETSRGAGLGLAIAQSIAIRHGGRLGIERRPSEVNMVQIEWPPTLVAMHA